MNQEQIAQWIEDLKQQAQQAMLDRNVERSFALLDIVTNVERWLKDGMQGDLPVNAAELHQLNIALPGMPAVAAAAPVPPDTAATTDTELQARLIQTPVSFDADSELSAQLQAGVAALEHNDLTYARQILRTVVSQAEGALHDQAQLHLQEAQRRQQQREEELVAAAQTVDRQTPTDLEERRKAWREVRATADSDGEAYRQAEQALKVIEQTQQRTGEEREVQTALDNLRNGIRVAESNKRLSLLQDYVSQLEELRTRASSTDLSEKVINLLVETNTTLNALKEETGQVRTLLVSGDREAAYKRILKLSDQGLTEVWDPRYGTHRPASDMMNETASNLIEFRKEKALDRQQQAQRALTNGMPQQAVRLYQEAINFLTNLTLRTETRDGIEYVVGGDGDLPKIQGEDLVAAQRADLQLELEDTQALLDRWNSGRDLFQAAEREANAQKVLGLLRAARSIFNQEPPLAFTGLEEAIQRREEDLSATLAVQVENACIEAEAALSRNDFATARDNLSSARAKSIEVQNPSARLKQAITRMEQLTVKVSQTEKRFTQVGNILQAAQAAIDADPPDPVQADELLNELDEAERKHPQAITLKRRIATMQNADKNWTEVQQAYREANWQVVIDTCELLVQPASPYQQQAILFHGRARAMLQVITAQKQMTAVPPEFAGARQAYTEVITLLEQHGTDTQTQAALTDARQQVTNIDALIAHDTQIAPELERVKKLIEDTRQTVEQDLAQSPVSLALRPEWRQANETLTALLSQDSIRTAEIKQLQATLFEAWRTDYIERIRKSVPITAQLSFGYQMVQELQTARLLYDPADRRLAREIELDYLIEQTTMLKAQPHPDWQKIAEYEQRTFDLIQMGYRSTQDATLSDIEMQQRLYSAKVNQLRSEIQSLLVTNATEAAAQRLEQALTGTEFHNDVDLTIELMKLYLKLGNFAAAYQSSQGLRYANIRDATAISGMWYELTRAEELFSQGAYGDAIIQMEYVKETFPAGRDQVQQWLEDNIDTTVSELIRQAIDHRNNRAILDAVQNYAQAQQLLNMIQRTDRRVTQGLADLSSAVARDIKLACQSAEDLKMTERDPDTVVNEATRLLNRLKAIQQVYDQLNLDRNIQDQLDRTLDDVEARVEKWQQGLRKLREAHELCNQARRQTWDFREARRLAQEVRREEDFQMPAKDLLQNIEIYEKWVKDINPLIDQIDRAIQNEAFSETIQICNQLETLWSQMHRALDIPLDEEGFKQQKKLQHFYGFTLQQRIDDWQEHRRIAFDLQTNYEHWHSYAATLLRLEGQARSRFIQAEKALNDKTQSLRELAANFRACQTDYTTLQQRLAEMETMAPPQSTLALKEQQSIKDRLQRADLEQKASQSDTYAQSCNDHIAQLEPLLNDIEKDMRNPKFGNHPPNNTMLETKIRNAEDIDPLDMRVQAAWEELARRREQEKKPPRGGRFKI